MHDAGHEVLHGGEALEEFLAARDGEGSADRADEDREEDEREHVADAAAAVADKGAEEISRHEHFHERHEREAGLRLLLVDDVGLRGAAEVGEDARLRLGVDEVAGTDDVHHEQAEHDRDAHVEEEEEEGAPGQRPELVGAAELEHAAGQRGEDERDDDEEQQPQEHLAERVEDLHGDLLHEGEGVGPDTAEREGEKAGHEADDKAAQDAIGQFGVGGTRHSGGKVRVTLRPEPGVSNAKSFPAGRGVVSLHARKEAH